NEGYLRTATERRSVLELARLVGYALRPGVAATVYLAYTIDEDRSVSPPKPTATTIPQVSRVQSIPEGVELPQCFETSHALEARSEWNNLQVALSQPQNIQLDHPLAIHSAVGGVPPADKIFVAGTDTKLKAGDPVLFVFGDNSDAYVLRTVQGVKAQFDRNRTAIQFQAVSPVIVAATGVLAEFVAKAKSLVTPTTSTAGHLILEYAQTILTQAYLGGYADKRPTPWIERAPVPYNAVGIFAVSDGTYVYCGGGWDGTAVHKDLLRCDPVTGSWESLASSPDEHYRSQAV